MEVAHKTVLGMVLVAIGRAWLTATALAGGISDDVVKIGVLTDMSGQFSHESGEGAVTAVKMAVEDFGGKVLGKPIEVVVADHQNKPDIASAIARKWFDVEKVDMIANLINSSIALGVSPNRQGEGPHRHHQRLRVVPSDQRRLHAEQHSLCLRHLFAGARHRQRADEGRRNELVFPDRRLCVRPCAGSRYVRRREGAWAARSSGSTRYPVETLRSVLVPAPGAGVEGQGRGAGRVRYRIRQRGQVGAGVRHPKGGQTLAGLLVWITDIKSLGLETAQGLVLTNAFYWDRDDETRAWSKRFFERMKRMPHMGDAGDYSSTMHYLKAIEAAGTDEAQAVMSKMREMPINDFFAKNGRIREDGRMVHDMYVYEVKKPSESKGEWDYYKLREVIPGDQAFRPLKDSACPLVKKG